MIKQFKHKDITWIDAQSPTKEELQNISKKYNIHSLVESEASSPSNRSHLDVYENYLYLILQFPACSNCFDADVIENKETKKSQEVNFILGENFLITIHYDNLQPLEEFGQIFDANLSLKESNNHSGYLFFQILIQLYKSLDIGLSTIEEDLKKAEVGIFSGKEKDMVIILADINRSILDFNWTLKGHRTIIKELEDVLVSLFDDSFRTYMRSIRGAYVRVYSKTRHLKEMFEELRITNDSLLTIKTNEIMKILTIMAFITFPLSVLTSTFGMNTTYTPILGHPLDFWIIVILMLVAVALMFSFFRYKNWI